MKKVLLGLLVIVVAGVIAAPYVCGLMMEKVVRGQLVRVNEIYAGYPFAPNIEIKHYERGFGSSEIEWVITVPQLQEIEDIGPIIIVEKAQHGYMGVTSTTSLAKNSWYGDFIQEHLNGNDPLSMSSKYDLFGGVTATITLDAFELLDDKENHFLVKPGQIVVHTDRALETVRTEGQFEGFSVPGQADVNGFSLKSDMTMISSFIMDGASSFSIDQISVKDEKGTNVAISALNIDSVADYDEEDNQLSITAEYSVDKIVVDDEKVDDVHVRFGISQLDAEGLENVYTVYTDMLSEIMLILPDMKENPEQAKEVMDQQMALVGMRLVSEVEKLLKEGLQIEIDDLSLTLPQGKVEGDLAIGLKKDMTMVDFIALSQQPDKIFEVFAFSSAMTLPDGLVPDQQKLLVPLLPGMQTGVFEVQGEHLVHKAEIKGDRFFLNDKELVLPR